MSYSSVCVGFLNEGTANVLFFSLCGFLNEGTANVSFFSLCGFLNEGTVNVLFFSLCGFLNEGTANVSFFSLCGFFKWGYSKFLILQKDQSNQKKSRQFLTVTSLVPNMDLKINFLSTTLFYNVINLLFFVVACFACPVWIISMFNNID